MSDPLVLTVSAWMSAPRTRVGGPWTYTARCCVNFEATLNGSVSTVLNVSEVVEYRTQIGGLWTGWALLDPTGSLFVGEVGGVTVAANQCLTVQFRGDAFVVGEYDFTGLWSASAAVADFGSDAATSIVSLTVAETILTTTAEFTRTEGVSCLGVGTYDARVVARKTPTSSAVVVGELDGYSGNWSRLLNTTSEASMRFALTNEDGRSMMVDAQGRPSDCCSVIRSIDCWRHELELYRTSTARAPEMVWAGPITDKNVIRKSNEVQISAKDLSAWWQLRKLRQTFESRHLDLATIFENYVNYTRIADDYGLEIRTEPTGVFGDRTVDGADLLTVADELNELDRTGVDWTICNRTGFFGGKTIGGANHVVPTVLRDESFRDPPDIRQTGIGQGNEWFVKARTHVGHYGGAGSDGVLIQRSKTEYSIEDQASADAAAKTAWDRSHEPLMYVQGDNALDPKAEIDIQELVPGVLIPFDLAGGGCLPYAGSLRLERVAVNFTPGSEEVSIYAQPIGSESADV